MSELFHQKTLMFLKFYFLFSVSEAFSGTRYVLLKHFLVKNVLIYKIHYMLSYVLLKAIFNF